MAIGNARLDTGRQADENCLKVILTLHMEQGSAYISDIAEAMEIPISTAYNMVRRLVESKHVYLMDRPGGDRGPKQSAELTDKGAELAKQVVEKHGQIYEWLLCLGIPDEEADEEACHWEHSITDLTMKAIQHHVSMMRGRHGGPESKAAIKKMMNSFELAQQKMGEIGTGKLIAMADRCGGTSGLQRKIQLSERAGGDDQIETALDFLEEQGGIQKIPELRELLCSIEERGGKKRYAEEIELIESFGGMKRLAKLRKLADKFGGVEPMIALLRKDYRLWSAVIAPGQESPDENGEE